MVTGWKPWRQFVRTLPRNPRYSYTFLMKTIRWNITQWVVSLYKPFVYVAWTFWKYSFLFYFYMCQMLCLSVTEQAKIWKIVLLYNCQWSSTRIHETLIRCCALVIFLFLFVFCLHTHCNRSTTKLILTSNSRKYENIALTL